MDRLEARWIVAVTGASGACYALRLLRVLAESLKQVHLIVSSAGAEVLRAEEDIAFSADNPRAELLLGREAPNVVCHRPDDFTAEVASGSALLSGMVIVPCTMATLAAVAHGVQMNLIHRAADVMLKERRPLVIVPRETPLSPVHLDNMLSLSRLGVRIVPAMPGFYSRPKSIEDLIDMQVMKILDAMGLPNRLGRRWAGPDRLCGGEEG